MPQQPTSDSVVVPVRFSNSDLRRLEAARGSTKRSTWIKSLVRAGIDVRERAGAECALEVRERLSADAVASSGTAITGAAQSAQPSREQAVLQDAPRRGVAGRPTLSEEIAAGGPGTALPKIAPRRAA